MTGKLFIVKVKVRYPTCLTPMQDNIQKQYIDGLVKNENRGYLIAQEGNDFIKMYYEHFKRLKPQPGIKVYVGEKECIDTFVCYMILGKYDGNKLVDREVLYTTYPEQRLYKKEQ